MLHQIVGKNLVSQHFKLSILCQLVFTADVHTVEYTKQFAVSNQLTFDSNMFNFSLSRHYKLSVVVMCFLIPTVVPWFFWQESLWVGYLIPGLLRYTVVLNASWLVNSAAHMWGMRPYDHSINPRENKLVAFSAIGTGFFIHFLKTFMIFLAVLCQFIHNLIPGEGFHNYHHTFPHDYATSEFGSQLNLTKAFIDIMCYFGLASDCRRVPHETIMARVKRTGDGSHKSG